ncbi:MAG TPA: tetratricopeptide repeat protein [Phycisphaerae bacterium]|nr:tetratricopeptide repeat protein [Phycisphaerae bacterium]
MAKRVNKNLIVGLTALAFIVVTGAGLALVNHFRLSDPTELVARAEEFAKSKDWNQAATYYRRAYGASEDPIYLVRFADMLRSSGRDFDALAQYRDANVIDPELVEALEKTLEIEFEMADMVSGTNNWISVRDTADAILKIEGQENHPQALYAKGTALFQLKEQNESNAEEGIRILEQAVEQSPDAFDFARRLAACYSELGRNEDAEAFYSKLISRTTTPGQDAAEARCVAGRQKFRQGDFDGAAELFADALKMAGSDESVRALVHRRTGYFLADLWRQKKLGLRGDEKVEPAPESETDGIYDQAVKELRASIELEPDEADTYIRLAGLQSMNEQYDEAIKTQQERLDLPFLREGFSSIKSRRGRYILLLGLADQYISKARLAESGSDEQEELGKQADAQIEEALTELPNGMDAYYSRGRLFLTLKRNREAIRWFERAEELSRGLHWQNLYFLAVARLGDNQPGAARDAISKAIADPSAPADCWILYSKILIAEDSPEDALRAADHALVLAPGNQEAMLVRAAAQEKLGQKDIAKKTIFELTGDSPKFIAGQAAFIAGQGDLEEALSRIEVGVEKYPTHPRIVETAAAVYMALDRKEDATRVIDNALAQSPDDFELQVVKIKFSDMSQEARIEELLKKVNEIEDEYSRSVRLSTYYAEQGDLEKQYELLEKAKQLIMERATPSARNAGVAALRQLFDTMFAIAIETNNTARMDELVKEATDYGDEGLDQAHGLTYLGRRQLYDGFVAGVKAREAEQESRDKEAEEFRAESQKQNEAAVETLLEAIDAYPTSGEAHAGLGDAYRRLGELNEARIAYEKSIELRPHNGKVLKQLAAIADALGNEEDFKKWLSACSTEIPDDSWVLERTLEAQEELNPREGIARREELFKENPDDAANLQKLAMLYVKLGDKAKAEERIENLVALPEGKKYLKSAASMLRDIDKPDRALEILQQNLWDAPSDQKAQAQLLIGEHYRAVGNVREAQVAYLAAADIEPSQAVFVAIGTHFTMTSQYEEANKWLEKAIQKAEESGSAEKSRIQVMQIEVLTRAGKLDEAQQLCDAYKKEFPEDPSTLFLDSQIALNRGEIDDAIEDLTLFLEKRPNTDIAVYNRAQSLCSLGEWQNAITDLEELRASNPTALGFQPRILLATAYKRVGRLDLAFQELESIYKEHPEANNVIDQLINLYVENERYTDADNVLTTLLNSNPNQVGWLLRSGEIALKQNDPTKAIANQKQAVVLGQFHPTLTATLLETYSKVNAADQGIAFFDEQVPPSRRTPLVLLAYANLLGDSGDVREAINTFRTALHKSGFDSFEFLEKIAYSVSKKLGAEKAIEQFSQPVDQVLAKANKHILSALLQDSGKIEEAIQLCNELLETANSPKEKASIYMRIAVAHESIKEWDKAREVYEQALAIDPDNLFALNNLAYLLSDKLDLPTDALPYAKKAAEISSLPAVLDTLGWVYYQLGQYQDAIAQFTRIRRTETDFPEAVYHLAEAFRRSGEFDKARTIFEELAGEGARGVPAALAAQAREGLKLTNEQNSD